MINKMMKRVIGNLFVMMPLAFAAGQANADLIITVLWDDGTVTESDSLTSSSGTIQTLNAIFTNTAGDISILDVTATSEAPDGLLRDVQLSGDIQGGVSGVVTVSDNEFVTSSSPSIFTTNSIAFYVNNIDIMVGTTVQGTSVLSTPAVMVQGTTYSGSANVGTPTSPSTYDIVHTLSFANTTAGVGQLQTATRTNIPEPSMVALLGMGLVGFGFARRKSRSA